MSLIVVLEVSPGSSSGDPAQVPRTFGRSLTIEVTIGQIEAFETMVTRPLTGHSGT